MVATTRKVTELNKKTQREQEFETLLRRAADFQKGPGPHAAGRKIARKSTAA